MKLILAESRHVMLIFVLFCIIIADDYNKDSNYYTVNMLSYGESMTKYCYKGYMDINLIFDGKLRVMVYQIDGVLFHDYVLHNFHKTISSDGSTGIIISNDYDNPIHMKYNISCI